jgi:UDP-N-acetylmuramate: L-alanyl-gamma-D-glutamyl-meso-diaminopimelate ligase
MTKSTLPKHIHIIGICGVATSALAIAFHEKGIKVTGSDKGFFPPVSTELEKHGISFYAGWHPEKMIEGGTPDFVIVGTASGSQNPETALIREKNIPMISEAEARGKYFARKNSIVCAGTWGKTSTTAILSYILIQAGFDPSYVIGGLSLSTDAAHIGQKDWSVIEGDEYKTSPIDSRPKFIHLGATHLLLTSVSWDHADLYPTEKDYFDAFEKLVKGVPDSGLIVACIDNAGVREVLESTNAKANGKTKGPKIVTYGKDDSADYCFHSVTYTKKGLHFQLSNRDTCYEVVSPMLGRFNVENITGAFAMAHSIGIPSDKIIQAIKDFKGIKRRFEKRLDGDAAKSGVTILDCHAPTAEKAASVLASVREVYDKKIIAVYEPNIGGRQRETASKYDNAFKDADMVLIPRLTKLKVDKEKGMSSKENAEPMEGEELFKTISKTHKDCAYLPEDEMVVNFLLSQTKKGDVIVFLGSHGFRGMIEEVVKKLD